MDVLAALGCTIGGLFLMLVLGGLVALVLPEKVKDGLVSTALVVATGYLIAALLFPLYLLVFAPRPPIVLSDDPDKTWTMEHEWLRQDVEHSDPLEGYAR